MEVEDDLLSDPILFGSYFKIQNHSVMLISALNSPSASLPLITCSSSHRTSKEEDFLHPPGHLLLTLWADFTTHGLLFKAYQILGFSSHGSNSQELLLSLQLISDALHGSSFHRVAV